MYSINEIKKSNENYDNKSKELHILCDEVRKINDNLDLEEVKNTLQYSEAKELYELILSRNSNKERCEELKNIVENKKLEEYPQINDVHYYPVINNIDFLDKKAKIKLDELIKDAYNNRNARENIKYLDSKIIDFLVDNSIVEKLYIFHCDCGSWECNDKIITQETFNKLKYYWEKALTDETTHEEDEEMHYGCFETGCWNDGSIEICSLEDFNEHLRRIEYKVKVEPDMTLDRI